MLAPECVDKTIHRDDTPGVEQQQREHGALLLAAERKRASLGEDLDWSENAKIRHLAVVTLFFVAEQRRAARGSRFAASPLSLITH